VIAEGATGQQLADHVWLLNGINGAWPPRPGPGKPT
jgi:hypothetical protein